METKETIGILAALAQETRLEAVKLLIRHEPEGIAAGELARLVKVPQNTLSTHLAILGRAGLVRSARAGRSIIYRANLDSVHGMVLHLLKDCCNGRPELCAPLARDIAACCAPGACC